MTNTSLSGKTALVCGSTQGIGEAAAMELASLGAHVILLARNEAALKTTLAKLPNQAGLRHSFLVADFSNPDQLQSVMAKFIETNGHADILINNTGGPAGGQLLDADYSLIHQAMTQHLQCNHIITQALVPHMKRQNFGRIINIISTSVKIPIPGLGVSNTVRGAVASWAKTLAWELGAYGITVNNVLPGFTQTARLDQIIQNKCTTTGKSPDEVVQELVKEVPAKRFASPVEVASAIAFLATPAAGYINGINLPVDGGRTGCL